jgi:hypothetical protein
LQFIDFLPRLRRSPLAAATRPVLATGYRLQIHDTTTISIPTTSGANSTNT